MKNVQRVMVVAGLVVAVGVVLAVKQREKKPEPVSEPEVVVAETLPALIDLGAGKCIPCKMMAPILEELAVEYADQFSVTVYDVWEQEEYAKQYGIRSIPTQIFLDADGVELYRHEGFMAKADILKQWASLGVPVNVLPDAPTVGD